MHRRLLPVIVFGAVLIVSSLLSSRVSAHPQGPVTPAAQPTQTHPWPPLGVERVGPGVTAPQLLKDQKPRYTQAARDAGIEGRVEVEAVVLPDGKVGDVRIARSLDTQYGLDQAAIDAVQAWEFKPGRKGGHAVPVLVSIELTFSVRG